MCMSYLGNSCYVDDIRVRVTQCFDKNKFGVLLYGLFEIFHLTWIHEGCGYS